MSTHDNGGPAFPNKAEQCNFGYEFSGGMTLRQYAAIKLRVPDSGTDWLDAMIHISLQDEFASKAMQGVIASCTHGQEVSPGIAAKWCYEMADAMLEARK